MILEQLDQKTIYAIGLMSGTSLDGIDVALVKITRNKFIHEFEYSYSLAAFTTYPYTKELKNRILKNSKVKTSNVQELCSLHKELGIEYVNAVNALMEVSKVPMEQVVFIANHGQTVWHNPNEMDGYFSSTMQIGDSSELAYQFNKTVVYDFRSLDMSAGGEGAPLIPMSEYMMLHDNDISKVLVNIGGIGNITYLKADAKLTDVIAFDTGPGNMLIDGVMRVLYHKPYDESGEVASKGKTNESLLAFLMKDKYIEAPYPKSTGREKYSDEYIDQIIKQANLLGMKPEDIVNTVTAFTATSIVMQVNKYFKEFNAKNNVMIISGGGSHNKTLIKMFKKALKVTKVDYSVVTADEYGYSSDAKEAVGFVVLGHLRLLGRVSNVKSVTGAKRSVSLGSIILPPYKEGE